MSRSSATWVVPSIVVFGLVVEFIHFQTSQCRAQPETGTFKECRSPTDYAQKPSWCAEQALGCLYAVPVPDPEENPNCYSYDFTCPGNACNTSDHVCHTWYCDPNNIVPYGLCAHSGTVPTGALGTRCKRCEWFACAVGNQYDDFIGCETGTESRCQMLMWRNGSCDPESPYWPQPQP